jgi:hypothetical protein
VPVVNHNSDVGLRESGMNHIKTVMFLALLTALLFWLGQELAGQVALLVALMAMEIMKFGAYWWLDKIG